VPERYLLISGDALSIVMEILAQQAERDNPAAGFLLRDIDKTQARFDDRGFTRNSLSSLKRISARSNRLRGSSADQAANS
jgi:hypothetical protein